MLPARAANWRWDGRSLQGTIEQSRCHGEEYQRTLFPTGIYRAVLEEGVGSLGEFHRWRASRTAGEAD